MGAATFTARDVGPEEKDIIFGILMMGDVIILIINNKNKTLNDALFLNSQNPAKF